MWGTATAKFNELQNLGWVLLVWTNNEKKFVFYNGDGGDDDDDGDGSSLTTLPT